MQRGFIIGCYKVKSIGQWGKILVTAMGFVDHLGPSWQNYITISYTDLYLSYFDPSYKFPGHNDSVQQGLTVVPSENLLKLYFLDCIKDISSIKCNLIPLSPKTLHGLGWKILMTN